MGVIEKVFREEPSEYVYHMSLAAFWRLVAVTAGAGLVTWALATALDKWVIASVFCSEATANLSMCASSASLGGATATVLVGVMMVPFLVMLGVRRPLLVVVAATIALWEVPQWLSGSWLLAAGMAVVTYAAVYTALVWLNRIRGNAGALLCLALFVLLARVVIAL